jgi:glycosyltransferase involved in cell wall biosynthesis
MTVSVIMPTFNRRRVIGRAISSVLSQTHPDYELIVIDDGSTDGTSDWLAQQYPGVRLIRRVSNRGAAAARNFGFEAARGEFIAFLDSDDVWTPEYLQHHIQALTRNSSAVLSYGALLRYDGDDLRPMARIPLYPDDPVKSMLLGNFIETMSQVVVPRQPFERVGMYLDERLQVGEDVELYLRLFLIGAPTVATDAVAVKSTSHDGLVVRQGCDLWAAEGLRLLDIFFQKPEAASYGPLRDAAENALRSRVVKLRTVLAGRPVHPG